MRIGGIFRDKEYKCRMAENMQKSLSSLERKALAVIQQGFPATSTPYRDMAHQIGVGTEELLKVLRDWKEQGKLRRIGAIVNHVKVGIDSGAMVVWEVESDRIEQVGKLFAGFDQVSHAYEREVTPNWLFNVYTMVHGVSPQAVEETVRRMSELAGVSKYRILATEQELKKVPPTYIVEPDL